jgi:hypothetical protein
MKSHVIARACFNYITYWASSEARFSDKLGPFDLIISKKSTLLKKLHLPALKCILISSQILDVPSYKNQNRGTALKGGEVVAFETPPQSSGSRQII